MATSEGVEYVKSFVLGRLREGKAPFDVLAEFGIEALWQVTAFLKLSGSTLALCLSLYFLAVVVPRCYFHTRPDSHCIRICGCCQAG
jgi:hypothetical protein